MSASDNFVINEKNGTILFKVAGTYAIHLDLFQASKRTEGGVCEALEVRVDGNEVHCFFGLDDSGTGVYLNATCLIEVRAGELASVVSLGGVTFRTWP